MEAGSQTTGSLRAVLTAYRYCTGLGVPCMISAMGLVGRKVARGPGWAAEDFYLGPELTLAGVSGALVNLFEILKPDRPTFGLLERKLVGGNLVIAVSGLLLYYITLSLRQDYGPGSGKSKQKQLFFMLAVSNGIGVITLFGALLLMAP